MQHKGWYAAGRRALGYIALSCIALGWILALGAQAQGVSTTTVQGTVYLANGQPGAGTLVIKWPAFTTAAGQAITAGSTTVTVPADGFVSVDLAPNQGATPAGEYYTAVYYLSDGSTSTEYWVVPAASQAALAQVRAQVMPAAQAVQAASKTYVDQTIAELSQSLLTASGGNLSGPLYLNGDPSQALQAATKHYVDSLFSEAVPLTGAALTGPLTATRLGAAWQVDQFPGADFGARLQACVNALDPAYGGTCDARNFTGNQSMSANLTVPSGNTTVLLPCATISTASQIIVPAGVRNVALRGCALRGGGAASGSTGGTAFAYSGAAAMVQVGDPTYAADTPGFHMDNAVIDTTASASATAQAFAAYRTQELDLASLYLLGNANQTGMTLDGTGNYTGGTFLDDQIGGFQTAVNAIGHQVANSATTDWLNASTFLRLHIDCPTSSGSPIAGTFGINLQQGDGNTFTGGDVEGCATALHLGANAQNNTVVGLRNENSNQQVVADAGSSYNNWITGGTMFTGQLTDNGTRNSFLDTFHRSFNALNGDWYGSQQDTTLTNHYRLGIGTGNERGLLNRYQTDAGYRWTMGLSDATAGEQFYQVLDELNNVYRISIGQYNSGQSSTNNQTVLNSAGTGAVVLNGSNGSGTGGVIVGSGGPSETTVATVDKSGNAQFTGTLQVGGTSQSTGTMTVRNNADSEVDYYLWPGLTASQKGSFTYKDWNGASQWYLVKDASNNWALNSALGGLDSFKAYQSTNSGDTYVNASNPSGVVRVNYETGSGGGFKVYGGNSSTLYASFTGAGAIAFPGLAAGSGHNCLQVDASGYVTNTGAACGTGSGSGTVSSSTSGYIAYYSGNGTSISGTSAVPVTAGGTGATTAAQALAGLGALPAAGGTVTGPLNSAYTGTNTFAGTVAVGTTVPAGISGIWGSASQGELNGAVYPSPEAAVTAACATTNKAVYFPAGVYSTAGLPVCSNLHIRCAGRDTIGAAGTVFRVTGANWGLYNPNADLTSGSNNVRNITVQGCGWDISTDPTHVLGAWRIKGISSSTFIGNNIFANSNANPAITEDGSNFGNNGGDYDNDFISDTLYDNAGTSAPLGGSTGIGIYVTACSTFTGCAGQATGGSNDNHHFGGGISRFGTSVEIDGGGDNSFIAIDGENPEQNCIALSGNAGNNLFQRFRCETDISPWSSGAKTVGIKILDANSNYETVSVAGTTGASQPTWATTLGATTTDGTVTWTLTQLAPVLVSASGTLGNFIDVYGSGYTTFVSDTTAQNNYSNATTFGLGAPGSLQRTGGSFFGSRYGWGQWGVNKQPYLADGSVYNGGWDVHGTIQSDRMLILCQFTNGCYTPGTQLSFSTSGSGTGAVIVVSSVANGQITGIAIQNGGSGYAVGDTLNAVTQTSSSGAGAVLTVASITGSGAIGSLTITNGGAGGYAELQFTGTGAQTYTLPPTGGALAPSNAGFTINGQPCTLGGSCTIPVSGSEVANVPSATYSSTTSSTYTAIYTTVAAGRYRVCAPVSMVTPGAGTANWQLYLGITSDGHSSTPQLGNAVSNTASAGALNAAGGQSNCASYYLDNGSAIKYSLNVSGGTPTTAPTLRYGLTVFYDGN